MIIVIMAFVFVVLTSGTIEGGSAIIGTLLASGYRRRELVAHYLALPAAVVIAAAVVGNVAGYTLMKRADAQPVLRQLQPAALLRHLELGRVRANHRAARGNARGHHVVGAFSQNGSHSAGVLRHETSKGGAKRGFALPERLSFTTCFRLRIFLRNLGNFATLFVGIGFASMLLLFSLAILPTMTHYAENLHNNVVAEHMYTLKAPLELDGTQADREAWTAIDELQSVEGDKLTAVKDSRELHSRIRAMRCKPPPTSFRMPQRRLPRHLPQTPCKPRKMRKMTLPARRTRLTQRRIHSMRKSIR